MAKMTDQQIISRIIAMEERLSSCTRCTSRRRCVNKPATGKGDLDPDILLVFQSQRDMKNDMKQIIAIRQMLKNSFSLDKIYHTFLVRCQPKSCTHIENLNCNSAKSLIDQEQNCRISKTICEGIPMVPGDIEIISCLHYLIEEIDLLSPHIVILFGERVGYFVLRAMGIFDSLSTPGLYMKNGQYIFTTIEENNFSSEVSTELASYITANRALA